SVDEKMRVLAEGLTAVYGEFTFEDLEKIEPKHAEKYLKAMLVEATCTRRSTAVTPPDHSSLNFFPFLAILLTSITIIPISFL
ncbi:MAG: hypothetical protein II848_03645, partial [Candidatus Methanomethylophilus sp.]|nr:hypothetical protein [Methanomethylophilus sp.]